MNSLFARIWLSYWVVMALALVAALAITFALAVNRVESLNRLDPGALAASAQDALTRNGSDGLRMWQVDRRHELPELQIYLVDRSGRELLNRAVTGQPLRGTRDGIKISGAGGLTYRMYVRRTSSFVFDIWNLALQPVTLIVLAIVASGLGSAWLSHYLTRPIVQLRTGVRAFAAGDLDARIGEPLARRKDELGSLAGDFDLMAQNLREHIKSKEELLRDVSHELRSPLARLRIASGLARRGVGVAEPAAFDRIDSEVEKIDALIGQILSFSRVGNRPQITMQRIDLQELVEEIAADAQLEAAVQNKTVKVSAETPVIVAGDPRLLRSAIENIARNAVRHAPAGTQIGMAVWTEPQAAIVEVTDAGPGVGADSLGKIFEPFFRGEDLQGAGLGLAIAKRVIELHQGTVCAENRQTGGLRVRVTVPREIAADHVRQIEPSTDRG